MIDVLIPTYARSRELQEAIWCVVNQSIATRAVVLNDCPWQTLRCDHPHSLIVNLTETFPTLGEKRSHLLSLARSPYVIWQDDDDLCLPWHAERLLSTISSRPDAIAALSPSCWGLYGTKWTVTKQAMESICRRDVALACGFPSIDVGEDRDFIGRIRAKGSVIDVPGDRSYIYRWNNGTHHVSGSGDVFGGRGFRAEAQARKERGEEPSGIVTIQPRLKTPYFRDAPLDVRNALPPSWL